MRAASIATTALVLLALAPGLVQAQGGGEGGGGLYDINTGLSVWTLIVFAILVALLGKFAWGPILKMVEEREKGIQAKLDEAAALNADAAKLLEQHREQLADARRQASELIAEGRTAAERVRKELEEKARAEGQAILERARAGIERERDAAIDMLRRESVDLALAAASKLMHENLDQAKDRALVERFIGELGGEPGTKGTKGTKGGARA
jgi:F-type H+-transporting ATPase subunit b